MRRNCVFIILLFSFLFVFSSCTSADTYFQEGNYIKTLEVLKNKKNLNKKDYQMKIDCLINLDRKDEAKESVMLYLLLSDETDDRTKAVTLFKDYEFSSVLTLLLLKDTDGINARILRYIAFTELNELDKASEILSGSLASELSITQFATLIVAHPIDQDYIISFFNAWYKVINESEKNTFYSLFFYYIKNNEISGENAVTCLKLLVGFESELFFKESQTSLALLYKTEGILCQKLNDSKNASVYYKKSYKLNPNDEELNQLIHDINN